uniref:Uncharacterized protein n=1 Tax=viral metagenome TaxID=1070528 RepID=A0A6C0CBK9_9ZZZZ
MGNIEEGELVENCSYCDAKDVPIHQEYYPHEAGGYCIFAPRSETEYACKDCASGICEFCNTKQPRYGFIDCKQCSKRHCYNNTDMKYEGNPFLSDLLLCNAHKCCKGG